MFAWSSDLLEKYWAHLTSSQTILVQTLKRVSSHVAFADASALGMFHGSACTHAELVFTVAVNKTDSTCQRPDVEADG